MRNGHSRRWLERERESDRREGFVAELEAVIPWSRLIALIEPHYPKAETLTASMRQCRAARPLGF